MLKINTSYCNNHQHSNIKNGVIDPKERDTNDTKVEPNDTNEEAILSIILKNPQATQGAIAKEVGASLSTVKRIMRKHQTNPRPSECGVYRRHP